MMYGEFQHAYQGVMVICVFVGVLVMVAANIFSSLVYS